MKTNENNTSKNTILVAGNVGDEILKRYTIEMICVEGGSFIMGNDEDHDNPKHRVLLSKFHISKYLITQALWTAIMGYNPSLYTKNTAEHPVDNVSWYETQKFIGRLNKITNNWYRLPTEAEWEYAAKGGIKSKEYKYAGSNNLDEVAWHFGNSNEKPQAVGGKKPNELGIFDMNGNVYEWCDDWYARDYYYNPGYDPTGPEEGTERVNRGGSWFNHANDFSIAERGHVNPTYAFNTIGFRLVIIT